MKISTIELDGLLRKYSFYMKSPKLIFVFLFLAFIGVVIFIISHSSSSDISNKYDDTISVSQLLANPSYGKNLSIYGQIDLSETTTRLSSEGESIELSGNLGAILGGIKSGQWIVSGGELRHEGDNKNVFFIETVEKIEDTYLEQEEQGNILDSQFICTDDTDCVLFGKTGECNCGCYHKENLPEKTNLKCFCQAPTSCKCFENQCEGVFENN
ncbi:MAG: hypothetical protein WC242_04485 [Candidatus Paceibacterota bacterium]|jgi:hypothetical protein